MLRLIALLSLTAGASCLGDDIVNISPKHTFEIVQRYRQAWVETLHFPKNQGKDICLEYGISWPANFYISPDDQWILRIQKSGSGDNISYLYQMKPDKSVWRMEGQLGELGFDFLERQPGSLPDLYHTGIEFASWDLQAGLLHFKIHGSGDRSVGGVNTTLTYHLLDHRITSP